VGDSLFIGSCSGNFYALDRQRGKPTWTFDATFDSSRPNFHGNALFAEDLVIVGTDDQELGYLYAFDRATGQVVWQHTAAGGFPSDVQVRGSRVYAVTMTGEVRCLKLETGEALWSSGGTEGDRLLKSAVVILGDRIIVSLPSGTVSSLYAESGEVAWETRLAGRLNTAPAVIGDRLYIGDVEGRIHQLSSKDGKALGEIKGEAPVYGSLLSAGDCLLALWGEDTLVCLDPDSGAVQWSQATRSSWSSFQPLILDEIVVVGTGSGEIHAFRLSDGSTAWTRHLEGEIKGLGTHEGVLYVGTVQGRVYAVRL